MTGIRSCPLINDGGQITVRPGEHSSILEKRHGSLFVERTYGCLLDFVLGIVEEGELRSARSVVFNRLDVYADIAAGIAIPRRDLFDLGHEIIARQTAAREKRGSGMLL